MAFKDHFSKSSSAYRRYRPDYPPELYHFLSAIAPARELAWDCATGTGQAAKSLAGFFDKVIATDASSGQIENAVFDKRIDYRVAHAEDSRLSSGSVNLVVVAQALHWFDINSFFCEAKRVLKDEGVIAVWSYNLLKITKDIDSVIENFYEHVLGKYWPAERRLVEQGYDSIAFPFRALPAPAFSMSAQWSFDNLLGYLSTWSAVRRYTDVNGTDPLRAIADDLRNAWGDRATIRIVTWPLTLRVGINDSQV
jgi:SAM-dependent methyltransferase